LTADLKNKNMESKIINISDLQTNSFEVATTSTKMNLSEVFASRKDVYLNEFNLFIAHFNAIPNFIHEIKIDCKRANQWFLENYKPK